MAGLFIFKNKNELNNIAESGAFVDYLIKNKICFEPFKLSGAKEIGTILSYENNNPPNLCRPFNALEFKNNVVIKRPITPQGEEIARDEINFYKQHSSFKFLPKIFSYDPLTMEKINGKNIFHYDFLLNSQKEEILSRIISNLKLLHASKPPIKANKNDCILNYYTKTLKRLDSVKSLIPFSNKEFIKINKRYYKNVFFLKQELKRAILAHLPSEFCVIHGDCTFSNILWDSFSGNIFFIDPRGYFGNSKIYGDCDYDFAKIYYSLTNYDQFNAKKFNLEINNKEINLAIKSSSWEDSKEIFFELTKANKSKIKLLNAIIWLSLASYAWEDYDSICAAFYNGIMHLGDCL